MPVYDCRLVAQDGSGHYRHSVIAAESEEEARSTLERREGEYELYRLTTEDIALLTASHGDVIAEALAAPPEAKMPASLPAQVRMKLALHRQPKPYKIVSCKERGGVE